MIEQFVGMIQLRGGRVAFVAYPTIGESWEFEENAYPKAQYWDIFAMQTFATTIHFKDYDELACFDCPDTSHLDYRDAILFTRSLLKVLAERHVLSSLYQAPK